MSIAVELANELIQELNRVIDELLEIPSEVFAEVGLSAVTVEMYEEASKLPEFGDVETQRLEAKSNFQKLCDAAPKIPVRAVRAISLAYGTVTLCLDDRNPERESEESILRSVMAASKILGMAIGVIAESLNSSETKRRQALSIAGEMGAKAKHRKPRELKNWAISQAAHLHGADAIVARRLAAILPVELADASKHPERLIYDALRQARKKPDSLPPVTGD